MDISKAALASSILGMFVSIASRPRRRIAAASTPRTRHTAWSRTPMMGELELLQEPHCGKRSPSPTEDAGRLYDG